LANVIHMYGGAGEELARYEDDILLQTCGIDRSVLRLLRELYKHPLMPPEGQPSRLRLVNV
jgi:hypothetical protein